MFRTRLLSGVALVILALLTIIPGGHILWALLLVISLIGYHELTRVFIPEKRSALKVAGFVFITLYYLLINSFVIEYLNSLDIAHRIFEKTYIHVTFQMLMFFLLALALLICLLAIMVFSYPKYRFEQIVITFFAFFYVAVMMSFVYLVRDLPGGVFYVWLVFICSWGCDTCAYSVGMTLGKHKLAPVLSPKKSVEGAIGGILGAALIGALYVLAVNHWAGAELSVLNFAIIGGVGGAISQIGDLSASAVKRFHNIKDYGNLIPGHGGILDRFDSVIFTAPIIYLLVVVLVQ